MKYLHILFGDADGLGEALSALQCCRPRASVINETVTSDDAQSLLVYQNTCQMISDAFIQANDVILLLHSFSRASRLAFTDALACKGDFKKIGWFLMSPPVRPQQSDYFDEDHELDEGISENLFVINDPSEDEGFDAFIPLCLSSSESIEAAIRENSLSIDARLKKVSNRNKAKSPHRYSSFLAFERLIYIVRALVKSPDLFGFLAESGWGALDSVRISSELSDLFIGSSAYGFIYSDIDEIQKDLEWLCDSGFVGEFVDQSAFPALIPPAASSCEEDFPMRHQFAGAEEFARLMILLRHLLHFPGDFSKGQPLAKYLVSRISEYSDGLWTNSSYDSLRDYIRRIIYGYDLAFDSRQARRGYFLGSAVVELGELAELVSVVDSSAPALESPLVQELLDKLRERLNYLGVVPRSATALSMIAERAIVSKASCRPGCLLADDNHFKLVSAAIASRHEIEISNFQMSFRVLPLQFLFHKRAWYLGCEVREKGRTDGCLRIYRLDRIKYLRRDTRLEHSDRFDRAFSRLQRLVSRTFGLPPNDLSYQEQSVVWREEQDWISHSSSLTVSCRLTPNAWKFIREGADRLPFPQLQLSSIDHVSTDGWYPVASMPNVSRIFTLPVHSGSTHPFEAKLHLPGWCRRDFDLMNWLLGFGEGLVVTAPADFREVLLERLKASISAWEDPP